VQREQREQREQRPFVPSADGGCAVAVDHRERPEECESHRCM
jgi:hypothetical protein